MGPRNAYKDMFNNFVHSIDHVVIINQNQTRTNGLWGYVRYTRYDHKILLVRMIMLSL
jgi:hypothetical protein